MQLFNAGSFILLVIFCVSLNACSPPEFVSEDELIRYVNTNPNLRKSVSAGDYNITATFQPTDLLVARELRARGTHDVARVKQARKKYNSNLYFLISLSGLQGEVLSASLIGDEYSQLLSTFSFRMSEFVYITTPDGDTVYVADYMYQRTFGKSNSTDLLFVFDKNKISKRREIQLNVEEFGLHIGRQSILFDVGTLEIAPKIYKP